MFKMKDVLKLKINDTSVFKILMFKTIDTLYVKNENRSKIENKGNLDAEN